MRSCRLAFALAAFAALAGCSSKSAAPDAPPNVRGAYVSTSAGPITDLTFVDAESYVLRPSGCADDACLERGTYAFGAAGATLVLTNAAGKTTSLPFHVASDPASAVAPGAGAGSVTIHPKAVAPSDLVGGDSKLVNDGPTAITVGSQTLIESKSFEITNTTGSQISFRVQLANPDPNNPDDAVFIGNPAGITLAKGTVTLTPGRQEGQLTDKTIALLQATDPSSKTTVTCIAGQLATTSSVGFSSLPLTCPSGWTTVPTE